MRRFIPTSNRDRMFLSLAIAAVLIFLAFLVGGIAFRGDGDGGKMTTVEPGGAGTTYSTSVSGRVVDTDGGPIPGALVRVSGPFRSTEAATNYETTTDNAGQYRVGLPINGEYDLFAAADVYEPSVLISGQDVDEVVGDFTAPDIVLKKRQEVVPQRGTAGFVFGEGVRDEEGVYRVLLLHGIISSRDEVADIFSDTMTGQGWSTFIRDGQSISVRPITYSDEPAWHVVLQPGRSDGLTDVFVQKACGNISALPGEKPPTRREVMPPTPTPTVGPSPTPPPGVTPTPTPPGATPTPPPPPTPTPTPRATPTPPPPPPPPTPTPSPTPDNHCLVTILGPERIKNNVRQAKMSASIQWDQPPNFASPEFRWYLDGQLLVDEGVYVHYLDGGKAITFWADLNVNHTLRVDVLKVNQVICQSDPVSFAEGTVPPGSDVPGTESLPTQTAVPAPSPTSDPNDGYSGP